MAIFACRDVRAGETLEHSYLPPRLLVLPRRARTAHLHFAVCECARCAAEPWDPPSQLRALSLPPGHASTEFGPLIASFKLASAAATVSASSLSTASDETGGSLQLMAAGDAILSTPSLVTELRSRPLAALDVCLPMIEAHWARRALSWQHPAELADGLRPQREEEEGAVGRLLPLAAELALDAAQRIDELRVAPDAAAQLLRGACTIFRFLLSSPRRPAAPAAGQAAGGHATRHAHDADADVEALRSAAATLSRMVGGDLRWLRDDLPFLDDARGRAMLGHLRPPP